MIESEDSLLSITVTEYGDVVVLGLVGELDLCTAPRLRGAVAAVAAAGRAGVVLDLGGLTFCDAAGLGVLVACRRRLVAEGRWMRLATVGPRTAALLRITGLAAAMPTYPCAAEAVADRGPRAVTGS